MDPRPSWPRAFPDLADPLSPALGIPSPVTENRVPKPLPEVLASQVARRQKAESPAILIRVQPGRSVSSGPFKRRLSPIIPNAAIFSDSIAGQGNTTFCSTGPALRMVHSTIEPS